MLTEVLGTGFSLSLLVSEFAKGIQVVDARQPKAKAFLPGIGPHEEPETVRLVASEILTNGVAEIGRNEFGVPYPNSPRQKCDWSFDVATQTWFVEVKMARFKGNNGKPADSTVTHIISPYERDRSALSDCAKLANSGFIGNKAVLIYGFDFPDVSLDPIVDAFELLAKSKVELGLRHCAGFADLIHPVHKFGRVFAWEIGGSAC